jgi:hypothetical protein
VVQVEPAEKRFPPRAEWDMAVFQLSQTKLPKGSWRKLLLEVRAEEARLGKALSDDYEVWEKVRKEAGTPEASDYADIEKSALEISSCLGMLKSRAGAPYSKIPDDGFIDYEPLDLWAACADEIQAMFFGRDARQRLPRELSQNILTARMEMVLFYGARGISVQIVPYNTGSALLYHAAQMITHGTKLMNCAYCGKPFFSGGEGRGGGKRRRDARFCSSEHRWQYHNEMRAARKRKL